MNVYQRVSIFINQALLVVAFGLFATTASASWYAGVNGGASSLRPDVRGSGFELDSSVTPSAGVFLGYDIGTRLSTELGFNYLGAARLSNTSRKTEIGYSAISVGGLLYVYGDSNDIAERDGLTGYVRLGFNSMRNKHDIPLERADNVAIWAGAGVEFPIGRKLSMRGELVSFDGDAQAVQIAAVYRPRKAATISASDPQRKPSVSEPKVEPTPEVPKPAVVITEPTPELIQPQTPAEPRVPESSTQFAASCALPAANEPVTSAGCALFSGELIGVEFANASAVLTPESGASLDKLVQNLQRHPTVVVEIQGHTESFGNTTSAATIAKQRTIAVARYLAQKGISVKRLRARAFGHTQPIAADNTAAGKQLNNRIVLKVLQ